MFRAKYDPKGKKASFITSMEQKHERMSSALFQTSANQYKTSTFHRKAVGNQKDAQRNFIMFFIFTFASMCMNKYNSK